MMFQKEDIITSHLKKKAQSKLTLAISTFAVIITSTGYLFNSKEVVFLSEKLPSAYMNTLNILFILTSVFF